MLYVNLVLNILDKKFCDRKKADEYFNPKQRGDDVIGQNYVSKHYYRLSGSTPQNKTIFILKLEL